MPSSRFYDLLLRTTLLGTLVFLAACAPYRYLSGLAHIEAGDYAKGVNELQEANQRDPRNTRYRADWLNRRDEVTGKLLARAAAAIDKGQFDAARVTYETILAYDAENVRARNGLEGLRRQEQATELLTQATDALKRDERPLALSLANKVLDLMPRDAEALKVKREIEEREAREMVRTPTLASLYRKPVTLEFKDASVKMIFDVLSRTTGINFVLDKDVRTDQRTTLFLRQASLEDAVDMIAATNQLEKKVLNPTSVLVFPNTPAKAKEYQDLVVRAFYLNSANATQTANLIKSILKLKDVFTDDKLGMIVVRDTPEAVGLCEKLVALYDLDEPEVMLEVEVLEVKRTRLLELGIQFTDTFTVTPLSSSSSFAIANLSHLSRSNLGITMPSATATAHKEDGDVNLLANPRIRVRNRDKANILIGDKIPIITTTSSSTGFVSNSITYQDVGLKLDVEPTIYLRDEVAIKLNLEVSSLGSQVTTSSGAIAYQIGTRTAGSVLRLRDGETQVLAGLISDEERSSSAGLPGLGDLPLLGRLFSSQTSNKSKTEIVLSITPHLIRNIQRRDPASEMFWSGTEATLRTKPLQLRSRQEAAPLPGEALAPAGANPQNPTGAQPAGNAASPSALKLIWSGPAKLKRGAEAEYTLALDSGVALRGLPVQLGFDSARLQILGVQKGDFFDVGGQPGNFSQTTDQANGRVAVAAGTGRERAPGNAQFLKLRVKALAAGAARIDVITAHLLGVKPDVVAPALPTGIAVVVED